MHRINEERSAKPSPVEKGDGRLRSKWWMRRTNYKKKTLYPL